MGLVNYNLAEGSESHGAVGLFHSIYLSRSFLQNGINGGRRSEEGAEVLFDALFSERTLFELGLEFIEFLLYFLCHIFRCFIFEDGPLEDLMFVGELVYSVLRDLDALSFSFIGEMERRQVLGFPIDFGIDYFLVWTFGVNGVHILGGKCSSDFGQACDLQSSFHQN